MKHLIITIIIIVIIIAILPDNSCLPDNRETAVLISVTDGDTIKVMVNGKIAIIRYIGVDTPERDEAQFALATQKNAELLANADIQIVQDVSTTDKYGRLLRYVLANNKDVGEALLLANVAEPMTIQPNVSCSAHYETIARQ